MESRARKQIVIVGGGFAGMAVISQLKDIDDVDIILIDRANYFLFQPLLYQAATNVISPSAIANTSKKLLQPYTNVRAFMANVKGIDKEQQVIHTVEGIQFPYDYLVLATGAGYNFFGHAEFAEHAFVLKTIDDAIQIRQRILTNLERVEEAPDPIELPALTTFVVVGGGMAGVEMAAALAEMMRHTLTKDFKRIDPNSIKVILCEAGQRLLPSLPEHLSAYAARALADLGVEIMLNSSVNHIDAQGVKIGDSYIYAKTVIWCAGTKARPAAKWLGASAARNGGVRVNRDFSVPGYPEIFCVGDVTNYPGPDGRPLPGLAGVAKQQGCYVGKLLKSQLTGQAAPKAFNYRPQGAMVLVGRSKAVGVWGKFNLTGLSGWLAWSVMHLLPLVELRHRLAMCTHWSWSFLTYRRGAKLLLNLNFKATAEQPSAHTALWSTTQMG